MVSLKDWVSMAKAPNDDAPASYIPAPDFNLEFQELRSLRGITTSDIVYRGEIIIPKGTKFTATTAQRLARLTMKAYMR